MECLNNIIGITASDCECITAGLTPEQVAAARKSTSGLYLDGNLEGGVALAEVRMLENCGEYYRLANKAILSAQKAFFDDVRVAIGTKYKSTKPRFIGELGRLTYTGFLTTTKPINYLKIEPLEESAAVLKINGARLNISATLPAVAIKLIQVLDGLPYGDTVHETTVATVANKYVNIELPADLKLPLTINSRKVNYFFTWEKAGNEMAVDNSVSCGCSGGDAFATYLKLTGGTADDYETLDGVPSGFANGFSIDAEVFCSFDSLVCDEYKKGNEMATVSAWAVLYKAGELLIEYVLQSQEINRFTMSSREYLWGKRNHFKSEYNNRLAFMGDEIDITASTCFVCRSRSMFVGNIYG